MEKCLLGVPLFSMIVPFVVINGTHSTTTPVTFGVPLGSILGQTLFLLFINDITQFTNSQLCLFTDVTVLYRTINSVHDYQVLQQDLLNVTKWASDWQMDFNLTKCHLLCIAKKRKPSNFTYTANSEALTKVPECDYLRVTCTKTLCWGAHCSKKTAKANKSLGLIRRSLTR